MSATLSDASVFTELNGLNSIRQLGKENTSQAMRKVAEQFEGIFLSMMLKGMRAGEDSLFSDNYLNSNEMKFHRENMDNQLALHMASSGGIGLADALHRQLMARYPEEAARAAGSATEPAEMNGAINPQRRFSGRPAAMSVPAPHGQAAATAQHFETQQDFVNALLPLAENAAARLGVQPRELIAQAALETGWGQKMAIGDNGEPSFNLFGIKAGASWQGRSVSVSTLEFRDGVMQRERADFRAYNSFAESFEDYVTLLSSQPRYQLVLADSADSHAGNSSLGHRLQQAGYATDPEYGNKIESVMNSPVLRDGWQEVNLR
ncbi:flagellar assembly peptidoglycan hydrolase FlgJ [Pseudohongiella spirulinae]|uniref:Peptidoglycan hydrolase FlgJ n=1 Tax=Pseudohongiella spirulinae TaxID=1249552 RepID=A0A0S2KEC6_9GAMM|nr:flagellar assembly peptidoglycan hydrolase FlgJ [Pseudohongiella spirulinae]ALO46650.1 glucosaminidase [Pseudohongiella spirulinae]